MPLLQFMAMAQNAVEPMQVDAPPEDNDNNEEPFYVVENPTLDLEAYANSYTGLAKLYRLIFVVDHCPALRLEALKIAISYVMTTYNVNLYQVLHQRLNELTTNLNVPDVAAPSASQDIPTIDNMWVETRLKKLALKLEKLDNDLKNYKSNSIKESIRRGHDDLGDHYLDCGDLSNALKCYSRARDYCTSGKHVVNMCLNVIKVSVYLQNWSHVLSYVAKAEGTPDFSESQAKENNPVIFTKLRCAAGLAELATRKYKQAAKHFLQASLDHCDFPELLSPGNVATYGGLCALATFDRPELQKHVVNNGGFKPFLELEPALRDAILKFYESKYAACLKLLEEMKDALLLDLYLAPHVPALYSQIRSRALVQYFSPYMSADLRRMAQAFGRTVPALEDELMKLILDGQIQARIDSHNKVLFARDADQRGSTFERGLAVGKEQRRRARMLVLRAAVLRSRLQVQSPPREQGEGAQQQMQPVTSARS
ncbi:COP9 signalosome complex subunit 1 [Sitophilus oryzae]|uniref:COP9 signalosome complex subunit 1 n=1 Tax=Sitophilus oryzae TaxID=7048 RepID=A0A6J2X2D6_SITOR|nr:COP9 signalosome complex subunit 1 [Sitophilus oryzae]